ncbi:hypothetical protein [Streptomyces sp. NRRL S-118]|uniref:hypothetical protein n=1 Tax=Streptomyces sp. NRRL S-118 TaxID=1463881 RepID=UPI0004C71C6A|nr:hypothetical protein [Streptomyces sp. NRRL S-118]
MSSTPRTPQARPAPRPPRARPAPRPQLGRARRTLRALAIASCLPYLALKTAWIAGSRIGIPDGSVLLEHSALLVVVNGVTVLMDAAVIVLALLLTQRWGLRVPAWLLAFPMWVATGLLVPIMVGYPVQLLSPGGTGQDEPFLHEWVFGVVYGGFIVQGITLGALFTLYARDRWRHVWRGGRASDGPVGAGVRAVAAGASLLLLAPAAAHTLWALGGTAGLPAQRIAERTADFHAAEGLRVLFAAAAVAGVLRLLHGAGRPGAGRTPLALAWAGSGAVGCWGGWMLLSVVLPKGDPGNEPTAAMALTYAGEMITGMLLACCMAVVLRRRARGAA